MRDLKMQCIHSDTGLCETCFKYETTVAEKDAEIGRLRASENFYKESSTTFANQRDRAEDRNEELTRRVEGLQKVAEAARRWKERKGHGADGHSCDLCDALTALDNGGKEEGNG